MQSVAIFATLFAVAYGGGLTGYSTGLSQAHPQPLLRAAPIAVAGPAYGVGYSGLNYAASPVAYASPVVHAPVAVAPVASSYSNFNRAPAARVAIAQPIAYASPAVVAGPAVATYGGAIGYGAPAVGLGYAGGLGGLGYNGLGAVRAF